MRRGPPGDRRANTPATWQRRATSGRSKRPIVASERWSATVIRDDPVVEAAGADEPTRPIDPRGV